VISVDAGYLIALLDKNDANHAQAVKWSASVDEGWITTWPVLTESLWMLAARVDLRAAQAVMGEVADGNILLWDLTPQLLPAMSALMHKYRALPMDFADASLVMLADHLGHGRILTTDQRDFGAYRWKSRRPFEDLMAQ
jgi:uncharacterized protein